MAKKKATKRKPKSSRNIWNPVINGPGFRERSDKAIERLRQLQVELQANMPAIAAEWQELTGQPALPSLDDYVEEARALGLSADTALGGKYTLRDLFSLARGQRRMEARTTAKRITSEHRTQPMTLKRAAKLMGYSGSEKKAAEVLRKTIDDGTVIVEKINRTTWIFDVRDFPQSVHSKIVPGTK